MFSVEEYFTVTSSQISAVLDYLFQFILVYICCFIGAAIRDLTTASKSKTKVDIGNAFIFSTPCAFIMTTAFNLISSKAGFRTLVLACVFMGMWSREVASLLLNNKVALGIVRYFVKSVIHGLSTDDLNTETDRLSDIFEDAVGNGKKTASEENNNDDSTLAKDDSQNCATANDDPPKDATPEESGKEETSENKDESTDSKTKEDTNNEESNTEENTTTENNSESTDKKEEDDDSSEELGGDPVGEYSWTKIIGY